MCYLISKINDASFKNYLIKEKTGGKLYEKFPSCILLPNVSLFLPQCTDQSQPFPNTWCRKPRKTVIFTEEKIFLHYGFENMLKCLALATSVVKDVSLMGQIEQWKGQILVPFKVKINQCGF